MRTGLAWKALAMGVLIGTALIFSTGAPVGEEASYVGEVEADEMDDSGNVLTIYLADTDEGDLLIAKNGAWAELSRVVGETVEVWGTLSASDSEDFDFVITVSRFKVIEDEDDDDDEDDDEDDEE